MANILIPTIRGDIHALAVKLALTKKGHSATIYYGQDFPHGLTNSFFFASGSNEWSVNGSDTKINGDKFDVVWYRRPSSPVINDKMFHKDDIPVAKQLNDVMHRSIFQHVGEDAFWVNPVASAMKANSKMAQLSAAQKVGLNVPVTLISNDPVKIKEFISEKRIGTVIYKDLVPPRWEHDFAKYSVSRTSDICLGSLPEDKIIQGTSGIFQEKICKAYEIRVMIFGAHCMALKLLSQKHGKKDGKLDWRSIPIEQLEAEVYQLPDNIRDKCIIAFEKLGIVFGCLDFIVTPDGEYYFLEINQMGQFLWCELLDENFSVLDVFCKFLVSKNKNFRIGREEDTAKVKFTNLCESDEFDKLYQNSMTPTVVA